MAEILFAPASSLLRAELLRLQLRRQADSRIKKARNDFVIGSFLPICTKHSRNVPRRSIREISQKIGPPIRVKSAMGGRSMNVDERYQGARLGNSRVVNAQSEAAIKRFERAEDD